MDCEGCEFRVVNKSNLNNLKKVKKLVLEYHESETLKVNNLQKILRIADFKMKVFPRKKVKNIGILFAKR